MIYAVQRSSDGLRFAVFSNVQKSKAIEWKGRMEYDWYDPGSVKLYRMDSGVFPQKGETDEDLAATAEEFGEEM